MSTLARPVSIKVNGRLIQYICPKCKQPVMFKRRISYMASCKRCGQRLDWRAQDNIYTEVICAKDSDEAAWVAKTYYECTGMKEEDWIDIDTLRQSLRGDGTELYLIFFNPRSHGRFMREYAKEGIIYDG